MKKYLWIAALIAALALLFVGCGSSGDDDDTATEFTVKFEANGGTPAPADQTVKKGEKATEPAAMTQTGNVFDAWYKEADFKTKWVFATDTVTADITLYARWTVTVTFNANLPTGSTAPTPEAINSIKVTKGGVIEALPYGPTAELDTYNKINGQEPTELQKQKQRIESYLNTYGLYFKGWFDAATGGAAVTDATTFAADTPVYAQWYTWDIDTKAAIVFRYNYPNAGDIYPDSPADYVVIIDKNSYVPKASWPTAPTKPGTVEGRTTAADTWKFIAWRQYEIGSGDTYQLGTTAGSGGDGGKPNGTVGGEGADKNDEKPYDKFAASKILYAYYEPNTGWPLDIPPEGTDLAGAEKVVLENAWFVVYKFTIPSDKSWSDYSGITVDYLLGKESWNKSNGARAVRLMGNYKASDFTAVIPNSDVTTELPRMAVAKYNATGSKDVNKNAPFIMDDLGASWTTAGTFFGLYDNAGIWKWFTAVYKLDASRKNSGYDLTNHPGSTGYNNYDDLRTYYLGIGIAGQGGGGTTQWIRNVKLIGNTGTASVLATPLWFKQDGDLYPAFTGYGTQNGNDGVKEALREMADGSAPKAEWIVETSALTANS